MARSIPRCAFERAKLTIGKVADAGDEAVSKKMRKSKDMVGAAAGVGVVGGDFEAGAMVHQAIDDIGGLARRRRDALGSAGLA